ncbi:Eco57I restriction-modification methylase domain-containing protein [bacterium]|nr:Eco57I restriction-modification methylase domain-containing protein [bacterium]
MLADTRDATVREMLRRKLQGDKDLWNYTRKLSVIRDSIYGVDIQPIAVEISKLRFFLSLVVDEKINENEDNRGIEPLPNLEFKFVCANTLIGLPPINEQMDAFEESAHVQKLKDLRDEYFTSYGDQKKNIEKEIDLLQKEMAKDSVKNKEARAVKLANWKPFSDEASSWFDPEWMFGLKDGFDIVIANPPYLEISGIDWNLRRVYETLFKTAKGRFDLYILFIEKAMKLKKLDGSFSYIVPGKFLNNKQFVVARQLICENYSVTIVKIDDRVFEASVNSAIVQNYFAGNVAKAKYKVFKISGQEVTLLSETTVQNIVENPEIVFRVEFDDNVDKLISKIKENTKIFKEIGEVKDGIVAGTIKDILFVNKKIDKNCKELFFGKHLSRYHLNNTDTWINYRPSEMMKAEIRRQKGKRPGLWMRNENVFKRSKIIYRKVATELVATYDGVGVYYEQTIHGATVVDNNVQTKFVLALFNSFLFKFYYHMTNSQGGNIFPQVRISSVENLPIKIVAKTIQGKIVGIVERILTAKQTNPQADTTKLEREIDVMVYKLYELTYDEVKIVDPEFWLSRAEYEKFEIKDA